MAYSHKQFECVHDDRALPVIAGLQLYAEHLWHYTARLMRPIIVIQSLLDCNWKMESFVEIA